MATTSNGHMLHYPILEKFKHKGTNIHEYFEVGKPDHEFHYYDTNYYRKKRIYG